MQIVYERVAGIDVHKKQITVAVRTPGEQPGKRGQQVRRYRTFYSALREMTAWLVEQQVEVPPQDRTPGFHAARAMG